MYTRIIQWVSNRLPYPTYRSPLGTRWLLGINNALSLLTFLQAHSMRGFSVYDADPYC